MNEKEKNEKTAKVEFEKRVRESKEKSMEENKKKALESGNVLTQTMNEQGELVSVKSLSANNEDSNITIEEVKEQLFEGENVVRNKD